MYRSAGTGVRSSVWLRLTFAVKGCGVMPWYAERLQCIAMQWSRATRVTMASEQATSGQRAGHGASAGINGAGLPSAVSLCMLAAQAYRLTGFAGLQAGVRAFITLPSLCPALVFPRLVLPTIPSPPCASCVLPCRHHRRPRISPSLYSFLCAVDPCRPGTQSSASILHTHTRPPPAVTLARCASTFCPLRPPLASLENTSPCDIASASPSSTSHTVHISLHHTIQPAPRPLDTLPRRPLRATVHDSAERPNSPPA